MARLLILHDPCDRIRLRPEDHKRMPELRTAELSIADDLEGKDIYKIAERLAGLLLEQIDKEST